MLIDPIVVAANIKYLFSNSGFPINEIYEKLYIDIDDYRSIMQGNLETYHDRYENFRNLMVQSLYSEEKIENFEYEHHDPLYAEIQKINDIFQKNPSFIEHVDKPKLNK